MRCPPSPNQLRWDPLPIPKEKTDFVDGIVTLGGNGDPAMQAGVAIHLYAANASMQDRFFYTADGEMLIVPQLGALRFHTELGILEVAPGEICVIPRGVKFRVVLGGEAGARLHLRELRPALSPARTRGDRRQRAGQSARLQSARCGL